jgi:hypothetical protein
METYQDMGTIHRHLGIITMEAIITVGIII